MTTRDIDPDAPLAEAESATELRARLAEAEETLRAIREGEVDALVVDGPGGEQVFTLHGADYSYRLLVEQMQEGAANLALDGQILYANRRLAEMLQLPLENVLGACVLQFVAPSGRAGLEELLASGQGSAECALVAGAKQDVIVPVRMSVNTLSLPTIDTRCVVVTDLTEQKRHQESIAAERLATAMLHREQEARAEAEAANRAKDQFLAVLGHELRNPLGTIVNGVTVLDALEARDPIAIRTRAVIHRQLRHLSRLVDDLLDAGRVLMGKVRIDRHPVDLEAVLASCLAAEGLASERERIAVDSEPVWIEGDDTRMEQIVSNLLRNAVKFTPASGAIRVTLRAEGERAVLRVEDTGRGIEAGMLERIFEPFYQLGAPVTSPGGGLGIGLTLVRQLVRLHGGEVEASSEGPGQGAIFTVSVPRVAPPLVPTSSAHGGLLETSASADAAMKALRIVIVEDKPDALESLAVLLELAGHHVHAASDGRSGLEAIIDVRPDVAFVDIGLPDIDGCEVARSVREGSGADSIVLAAMSGYVLPEDRERAMGAGFDVYLVKPLNADDLARVLRLAQAGKEQA